MRVRERNRKWVTGLRCALQCNSRRLPRRARGAANGAAAAVPLPCRCRWMAPPAHRSCVLLCMIPVGMCRTRTAVSTLFTFCPPLPPDFVKVISRSLSGITSVAIPSSFGITSTPIRAGRYRAGRLSMFGWV